MIYWYNRAILFKIGHCDDTIEHCVNPNRQGYVTEKNNDATIGHGDVRIGHCNAIIGHYLANTGNYNVAVRHLL